MADTNNKKDKSNNSSNSWDNLLSELNPLNPKVLLVGGIISFLLALANNHNIGSAILITLFSPVYVAVIWVLLGLISFIVSWGYEEGVSHAEKRGYSKSFSVVFGVIGVIIFIFIFG